MKKKYNFSPEVYKIEEELIQYFSNAPMFQSKTPLFIKVFSYFTTRQFLTQEDLKRITGLSSGSISEIIHDLLDDDLIEVYNTSKSGKITYNSGSAGRMLLTLTINILRSTSKWEKPMIELKEEFNNNRDELKDLEGFDELENLFEIFIPLFSLYKELHIKFEKAVEDFESSDLNHVDKELVDS